MKKEFRFRNTRITIESKGYGKYILTGLNQSINYTDSSVWDYCDDEENKAKCLEARRTAYNALKNMCYC